MKKQLILKDDIWISVPEVVESSNTDSISLEDLFDELINEIENVNTQPANPEDSAAAQAIYDQHKIEGAELIDCHITLPDGYGIINCRVVNEHKQIRF